MSTQQHDIKFVDLQKPFGIGSIIVCLLSLGLIFGLGPEYGIDFKGGSDIILKFQKDTKAAEVREAAKKAGFVDANVQRFGDDDQNQFMLQTSVISVVNQKKIDTIMAELKKLGAIEKSDWSEERPDRLDVSFKKAIAPESEDDKQAIAKLITSAQSVSGLESITGKRVGRKSEYNYVLRFQDLQSRVRKAFHGSFPDRFDEKSGLERLETVGPRVGQQLRDSSIVAIFVALFFILIYIGLRFDFRYAPGAVAALVHDVIISVGFLTLIRMEISLPIIAAMLAIVGYSLNDTIVVFDRIRENIVDDAGSPLKEVVNTSLNQTLSRTLITSITTLIAVVAIAVLGGGLIQNFAITLIIGVVVGTYSSIFIASPIFMSMDTWSRNRKETRELLKKEQEALAEKQKSDDDE